MKNLKVKFGLFSLLAVLSISVLLTSCEQDSLLEQDLAELDITELETEHVDDISYSASDTELAKYLEDIGNKLRAYKNENPNVTDKQLDEYADIVVQELASENVMSRYDLDGYITGQLLDTEIVLYNSNRGKALLCMANGVFAIRYAESNYQANVLHNGNGDAFRHILWNYGMTCDVGSSFAKQWSDAHEYGANGPENEKQMDLYNNQIGIDLGIAHPNTTWHSTFRSKSQQKVRDGRAIILVNGNYQWSSSVGER